MRVRRALVEGGRRRGGGWAPLALFCGLGAAACGSRAGLLVPRAIDGDAGGAATGNDDAGLDGGGDDGQDAGGSSSSDSGAGASSGAASGGAGGSTCASAADCAPGFVCCATQNLVANCKAGPCTGETPLQFCASAAECLVRTSICDRLLTEPEDSYLVCQPPR